MTTPRIFIGVAATGNCKTAFAMCKDRLVSYFPVERLSPEFPVQELTTDWAKGPNISQNFYELVNKAKAWKATHFLSLEEDMGFDHTVLHILFRKRQLWVGCNYPMKCRSPYQFTACALDQKTRVVTHERSSGLEQCAYTGFGVTLFDMRLFEMVEPPWFVMAWAGTDEKGQGHYTTQDAWFAEQVRAKDIPIYVDHDASKLVWHVGDYDYTWRDVVDDMRARAEKAEKTNE